MSVNYRKDRARWYVDTVWPDGVRTRSAMPDEATAKKIDMKIQVASADEVRIWKKLRKELGLEGGTLQGLSELADLYLEQWVKVHNRSLRSKNSRLNILNRYFGKMTIDSINHQKVDGYISSRRKEGIKNRTINRDLGVLRHMMDWAVKRGYLEASPMAQIERLEEVEWVGKRPDESVIDEVFAKLSQRTLPIFTFMRETGCRRAEAISLMRDQIDIARSQVVFHSNTKNGRSRQVPLTSSAIAAVSSMPVYGKTIFYNPNSLQTWTGDSLALVWEAAREEAGHNWIRMHDLRHAYGIRLAESGCPMHFISEVLGHYSIDFTRKIYAKFSPESASRAVLRVLEGGRAKVANG